MDRHIPETAGSLALDKYFTDNTRSLRTADLTALSLRRLRDEHFVLGEDGIMRDRAGNGCAIPTVHVAKTACSPRTAATKERRDAGVRSSELATAIFSPGPRYGISPFVEYEAPVTTPRLPDACIDRLVTSRDSGRNAY
jgi:hypothetical protein